MISSLMIQVTGSAPSGLGVSIAWLLPMLLFGGLVVGVIILLMSLRGRSRGGAARRLEVLERALEHPELDAETRAQLVASRFVEQHREALRDMGPAWAEPDGGDAGEDGSSTAEATYAGRKGLKNG